MPNYYVYCLIDPRTKSIFYIGKGKGKRVFQHVKEKESLFSNTEKRSIIKAIESENLEVESIILADNLSEDVAYLLEKMLVFRIGRSIFDEGDLTNIAPGGLWNKDSSYLINEEDLPSEEFIAIQYPEILTILEKFPRVSRDFVGLRCEKDLNDHNLYVYDRHGKHIHTWDINILIQIFGLGSAKSLIDNLKGTTYLVYAWSRVWSKTYFDSVIDTSKIPFNDFDIVDIVFVSNIKDSLNNCIDRLIKSYYSDGTTLGIATIADKGKSISLNYNYPNGNQKHFTTFVLGQMNGHCLKWHMNGQLKEETEYILNKVISKRCYHDTGMPQLIEEYNNDGTARSVKTWHENGQLNFENSADGTSKTFSESGTIIKEGLRVGDLHNGGNATLREYSEDGRVTKETKVYYIDGLKHGYERSFYDNGDLRREFDYYSKLTKTYKKSEEITVK